MKTSLRLFTTLTFIFILVLSATMAVKGQTATLRGTVVDSVTRSPLTSARVVLIRGLDSARTGAVVQRNGTFEVRDVADGLWSLTVSFVGYAPHRQSVRVQRGADIDVGTILLSNVGIQGKEVVVEEQMAMAVQKGDTVELNAGAFKTSKDASTEDLVQKMPGITVQNGQVQAQGERVRQVLVDGKQFFGDDPNAALRNLPAEMVDKIQIFDQGSEQSRFTGSSDPDGAKTLNIVTKRWMRNGMFGRITGGYGDADRYKGSAVVNVFQDDARLTVLAQTNNVNEQNFSIDDIVGAMGGGGGPMRGMMRRMGGMMPGGAQALRRFGGGMSDFLVDQQNGVTTTHALGLNYSDKWAETLDAQASYFFNYSGNDAEQSLLRQFILPGTLGQTYGEGTLNTSTNVNHRFRGRFELRADSMTSFVLTPRATAQFNTGTSLLDGANRSDNQLVSRTANNLTNNLDGANLGADVLWRQAFRTRGRTISVNMSMGYNTNVGDNLLRAINSTDLFADTLDQRAALDKNGWNVSPTITYTEPIDTLQSVAITARANYEYRFSDRSTFRPDVPNGPLDALDTTLTNAFTSRYVTMSINPTYRFGNQDYGFEAGASLQRAVLDNEQRFPVPLTLDRVFVNVLPNASFRWNISKDKNIRAFYSTRTSPPSVDQLQNVINNTNPLQLTSGNEDLRQDYSHSLFMRYSSSDFSAGNNFFVFLSGTATQDYVGNDVTIARTDTTVAPAVVLARGGQYSRPVNLDGYVTLRSFVGFGLPVPFLSSNVNLNLNVNYTRTPGLINAQLNYANAPSYGGGIVLSSNISERIDFTASTFITASQVRNTLRRDQDADYLNGVSRLRFQWQFLEGLFVSADVTNTLTSGLSADFNQSIWLVNASMGYKFMENDRAEVRLSIADLLKQNTTITRTVGESFIDDVQANQLQRYGLLTFSYNLRSFAGQPPEGR
jgi:hypothetical protein